jgi:hypothetical protein
MHSDAAGSNPIGEGLRVSAALVHWLLVSAPAGRPAKGQTKTRASLSKVAGGLRDEELHANALARPDSE